MNLVDQASNYFVKGNGTQGDYEDPTYFGFDIRFDFSNFRDSSNGIQNSPLFGEVDDVNESAEKYLNSIGAQGASDNLIQFKNNISRIQDNAPYYFQSVDGLKTLWGGMSSDKFDPYYAKDIILTFGCLESIDLLMTSTLDAYRKASFDMQSMRRMLPVNLRRFSMTLTITEMRKFNTIVDKLRVASDQEAKTFRQSLQTGTLVQDGKELFNDLKSKGGQLIQDAKNGFKIEPEAMDLRQVDGLASFMVFKLEQCEFIVDDSFPVESIDMGTGSFDMVKQQFKVKVGRVKEKNLYNLLGYLASSYKDRNYGPTVETKSNEANFNIDGKPKTVGPNLNETSSFKNLYSGKDVSRKTRLGQAVDQVIGFAENEALSIVKNTSLVKSVNKYSMGNVYDPNGLKRFLDRNQALINLGKVALS